MKGVILGVCLLAAWLATSIAAAETWVADEWRLPAAVPCAVETPISTVETLTVLPAVEEDCCLRLWIVPKARVAVPYVAWSVRSVPRYLRPWWLRGPVRRALSWPFR